MEQAIAKETRETSVEMLVSCFEQAMACVGGTFGDREAAALAIGHELVRRWCESRSTLERIGKRIGVRIREALPLVEPIVRASELVPADAYSSSVGLDRTTVPMAEPVENATRRRRRPYVRRPPEPITVAYRMAYVATVAVHDREGTTLISKRLGSTADERPLSMLDRLGAEVQHCSRSGPASCSRSCRTVHRSYGTSSTNGSIARAWWRRPS